MILIIRNLNLISVQSLLVHWSQSRPTLGLTQPYPVKESAEGNPGLSFQQFKPQGPIQAVSVYVRNIKKCMGILKSLNIVNLHRVMTMLKLKINVNLSQLLCIIVFVAQNG